MFVVPAEEVRHEMLSDVGLDGATVTRDMRERCREKGKTCQWLASARGDGGTAPPAPPARAPVAAPVIGPRQAERDLGLTRDERSAIQRGLNALSLEAGAEDGLFGEMTREAIRRYQRDARVPETGFLTADDAKALLAGGVEQQVAVATSEPPAQTSEPPRAEDQVAVGRFPTVPLPAGLKPGDVFRDTRKDGSECPECPEMVVIPAGTFHMGSADGDRDAFDDEKPQHAVTLNRTFAVGRFPVTLEEFDAFAKATGRSRPHKFTWDLRRRRPAANVTWEDAQAYVPWLREETGQPYRLSSEAEWE